MQSVRSGRIRPSDGGKKKTDSACALLCTLICTVSVILFAVGSDADAVPVSSPGIVTETRAKEENSFWESYAVFAARLFGYG